MISNSLDMNVGFATLSTVNFSSLQHTAAPRYLSLDDITFLLTGSIPSSSLYIKKPIQVAIELDPEGGIVISDNIFLVFGIGTNTDEAIQDYLTSLAEYYDLLADNILVNPEDKPAFEKLAQFVTR